MKKLCILVLVCLALNVNAQPGTKWPSTLLWRISGNGLQKPSYLYGTIHLQQKDLFYFGDSVYHALDQTEGYAMEIDPNEFMNAMYEMMLNREYDEDVDAKAGKIEAFVEKMKEFESAPKKTGFRLKPVARMAGKEKMSTVVDIYLYEWARSKGKWLGGLEDVQDHIGYIDELGRNRGSEKMEGGFSSAYEMRDSIVAYYIRNDLDKIHRFVASDIYDYAFNKRNMVMARNADSLSHIRSTFFAVGTAHLTGDSGVINLLRKKGFEVTPVFSSAKIPPVKKIGNNSWMPYWNADSTYTLQTPSKVSAFYPNGSVPLMMSTDLFEQTVYLFSVFQKPVPQKDQPADHVLLQTLAQMGKAGSKKDRIRKGQYMGFPSVSTSISYGNYTFPVQLVQNGSDVYLMMAASDQEGGVSEEQAQRFFQTLRILKPSKTNTGGWSVYTDSTGSFTVECPCRMIRTRDKDDRDRANFSNNCFDGVSQSEFSADYVKMRRGYYNSKDTALFTEYLGAFSNIEGASDVHMNAYTFKGYPACRYDLFYQKQYRMYVNLVVRGNMIYTLSVVNYNNDSTPNSRFFESFTPEPFDERNWQKHTSAEDGFSIFSPGPLTPKINETDSTKDGLISFDPVSGTSYHIFTTPYSPYRSFAGDSAWIKSIDGYYTDNYDSVVMKKLSHENGVLSYEMLRASSLVNTRQHVKYYVHADTLYEIQSHISLQQYASAAHQKLYNSMEWSSQKPLTVFNNKTAALLEALQTTDSVKVNDALTALRNNEFTKTDLPLFHEALLKHYPANGKFNLNISNSLENVISPLADGSTVAFIRQHYNDLKPGSGIVQADLLYLLAKQKTTESYTLLKDLLINQTPKEAGFMTFNFLIYDSLKLWQPFFPVMTKLLADTNFQAVTACLLDGFIDSGVVSRSLVIENEKAILAMAKRRLDGYTTNEGGYWAFNRQLFGLLAKLKTPAALKLLNDFSRTGGEYTLYELADAMLYNQLAPQPAIVQKLAASRYFRAQVYEKLKKHKQEKLLPAAYATQNAMGESLMFQFASDSEEWEFEKIQPVKEIIAPYKGVKYRFLVYKMLFPNQDDEEKTWYTGFCGPFPMDKKSLLPVLQYGQWVSFDKAFKASDIPTLFKEYMSELDEMNGE